VPSELDVERLRGRLLGPASPWTALDVVAQTGSTNADLVAAARAGTAAAGSVLLAELQVAGRGRLGRGWQAPPGRALTFSVLVAPGVPTDRWGWLPLLTGVALVDAVGSAAGVSAGLKWPNDLLSADGRKLAGVLTERVDTADGARAVVGIGLNVGQTAEELPVATATSLALALGADVDREDVLVAVLLGLAGWLHEWRAAGGDADAGAEGSLRSAYRARSATLDQAVRVVLPGDRVLEGTAVDVDRQGRLVLRPGAATGGPDVAVAAGDVVHVR
jgi:BirA family transcriptional regulator, biotin operon repressor / biotin---[acetyl-CoA-carboxylase] ligase